jgi:hypothetical protein
MVAIPDLRSIHPALTPPEQSREGRADPVASGASPCGGTADRGIGSEAQRAAEDAGQFQCAVVARSEVQHAEAGGATVSLKAIQRPHCAVGLDLDAQTVRGLRVPNKTLATGGLSPI